MKIVSLFPAGSEIICNLGLSKNLIQAEINNEAHWEVGFILNTITK